MTLNTAVADEKSLVQFLGQKLMLDFRYYCPDGKSTTCRTPMTELPKELAEVITHYNIGGVILFSENVSDIPSIVQLTNDLQKAASKAHNPQPLFIAIDQEGGRVARINRQLATSFTGNMSIGATYPQHGTFYATEVAKAIGAELTSLGINVNFAPTVDVNVNPHNPVINVRSFSENPDLVAKLGAAQVKAFEQNGVISALKHFPGHGDTHVDSHTGLPKVDHDIQTINKVDLAPFKYIIDAEPPGMIMTAHIQYPALDNTTLVNTHGKKMLKPATLSRKIMHNLLREKLGYQGVTITDALDMAGISDFFTPNEAVIEVFKAGVDIALMPIAIRTPEDIKNLDLLFAELNTAIETGELDKQELVTSVSRIKQLKRQFLSKNKPANKSVAQKVLGSQAHRALEAQLALDAITEIKNNNVLPISAKRTPRVYLLMPDKRKCLALEQALQTFSDNAFSVTCDSLQGFDINHSNKHIKDADLVISAHASPPQSAVEIGGMDDIDSLKAHQVPVKEQSKVLYKQLKFAQSQSKPIIFISLRAPYEIKDYFALADTILASYAYNIDQDNNNKMTGPAFTALAKVLLGLSKASGQLPVTIGTPKSKK